MADLISREDVLAFPIRINNYDRENWNLHFVLGIETVMEYVENLPSAVCDDCIWSVCNYNKVGWDTPSAEAEPKRVLQGYCKGADCKWWNPQAEGCNRCVFVKEEYTYPSAEAVQGEWKPFDLTWGRNIYFCTACKESTEVPTVNGQPSYNYCPNCGAIMKGAEQ